MAVFPSGALEGWRLQCRFSFDLEVRAKSLNWPLVKPQGPRSYTDSSSSTLLWQVNQNTRMLYCLPTFYVTVAGSIADSDPIFSCKKLLLLKFFHYNSRTQSYKAFPAEYVSILNTLIFTILDLFSPPLPFF